MPATGGQETQAFCCAGSGRLAPIMGVRIPVDVAPKRLFGADRVTGSVGWIVSKNFPFGVAHEGAERPDEAVEAGQIELMSTDETGIRRGERGIGHSRPRRARRGSAPWVHRSAESGMVAQHTARCQPRAVGRHWTGRGRVPSRPQGARRTNGHAWRRAHPSTSARSHVLDLGWRVLRSHQSPFHAGHARTSTSRFRSPGLRRRAVEARAGLRDAGACLSSTDCAGPRVAACLGYL